MHNENTKRTLAGFMRWLMRNGRKYPRVGCPGTTEEIVAAIKEAICAIDCSFDYTSLNALVSLATVGSSSMKCNPHSVPCVKAANRILRRMKKCQGTESQQ